MICQDCGNKGGMNFDCIACCVRWLRGMSKEAIRINAPVIENVKGAQHMEKVRQAWRGK